MKNAVRLGVAKMRLFPRLSPRICGTLPQKWRGKKLRIPIIALIVFLLAGAATATLGAERRSANIDERATVADFYRGKVVRIVVGFPPGGGADVYSRVLIRHLGRFIPGNPTLAVTNMPGAGSIIAGNHIFNAGAKDGTEIGMLNGAVILEQLFGNPGIHFDMARFRYLAVPVTETYVMIVARRSGIRRFSELIGASAKQIVLGAIPNSTLEHAPILVREALDANLKVVSGYKGTAEIRLAIDSEEIGGFFNPWSTVKTSSMDKFTNGQWSVILQLSDQSLPDLPSSNVPTIRDLTQDESQRMLLRYGAVAPNQFGKVYMLRDGVPAERAAALEAAFAKTFTDRNFLADAEKSKLEITPLYGESIRRIVDDFLTMPATIKERLRRAIKP
jgi:tripartite-type tricarboxylate transporter receptor subunit TctC